MSHPCRIHFLFGLTITTIHFLCHILKLDKKSKKEETIWPMWDSNYTVKNGIWNSRHCSSRIKHGRKQRKQNINQFVWVVSFLFSSAFSFCNILFWKTNKKMDSIQVFFCFFFVRLLLTRLSLGNFQTPSPPSHPPKCKAAKKHFHFQDKAVSACSQIQL